MQRPMEVLPDEGEPCFRDSLRFTRRHWNNSKSAVRLHTRVVCNYCCARGGMADAPDLGLRKPNGGGQKTESGQESGVRRVREGRLSGRWARQGSNLHGLLHRILSPARLPIPPRAHKQRGETTAKGGCGESFNWAGATGSMGHE